MDDCKTLNVPFIGIHFVFATVKASGPSVCSTTRLLVHLLVPPVPPRCPVIEKLGKTHTTVRSPAYRQGSGDGGFVTESVRFDVRYARLDVRDGTEVYRPKNLIVNISRKIEVNLPCSNLKIVPYGAGCCRS